MLFEFKIIELNRRRNRAIFSERAALQAFKQTQKMRLVEELHEGEIRRGRVAGISNFGAFVDLGGIDGLVHISQMSHVRIKDPSEIVKPGQKVQVQVLKIDREADKISLGMKHLQPDPWDGAVGLFAPQSEHTGRVTRIAEFGAFVELSPGLDGLVHVSELSDRHIRSAGDVVEVGQIVRVRVLNVDEEARRIALSMKGLLQDDESPDEEEQADPTTEKKRKKTRRGGLD